MTRNILESDEVDSKIFAGRVLSILGEILQNQKNLEKFLEQAFHVPSEYPEQDDEGKYEEEPDE